MDETDDEIVEIRRAHFAALALEADQVERLESQIRRLESELHKLREPQVPLSAQVGQLMDKMHVRGPACNRRSACGLRGVA